MKKGDLVTWLDDSKDFGIITEVQQDNTVVIFWFNDKTSFDHMKDSKYLELLSSFFKIKG